MFIKYLRESHNFKCCNKHDINIWFSLTFSSKYFIISLVFFLWSTGYLRVCYIINFGNFPDTCLVLIFNIFFAHKIVSNNFNHFIFLKKSSGLSWTIHMCRCKECVVYFCWMMWYMCQLGQVDVFYRLFYFLNTVIS